MAYFETRRGKKRTTYRVQIRLKGFGLVTKSFRRKTDAKAWAKRTEAAILDGRHLPSNESQRRTVGELAERFIAEMIPLRAPADRLRLTNQLQWWVERLGPETRLSEISAARLVELRDQLTQGESISGQPASPATVKRYLAILSRMFSVAVKEWFWMEHNPCLRVTRPREPRGRVRFLDREERERLLEACQASYEPRLYPLVLLALSTGARQGELMKLRWTDIDLESGLAVFHETKNGERRGVSITGPALQLIREMSTLRPSRIDLVFVNRWGRARFPREAWDEARLAAEIEDFTFHDLRHSAASYLAMSGATLTEIAEVLGHKTLAMVKRYSHLTEAHTRDVLGRMTATL